MDLINYTKQFSHEREYLARQAHEKFGNKLSKLKAKQDDAIFRGQMHENDGFFHRLRAQRAYRRADKLQRRIDHTNQQMKRYDEE